MPKRPRGAKRAANLAGEAAGFAGLSVLGAIPVVGPVVSGAITELEIRHISLRLHAFEQQLKDLAARVNQGRIDWVYVETVEYRDLAIASLEAARRTSNLQKLRTIGAILFGAASLDRPPLLDSEAMVAVVSDLAPATLQLLGLLAQAPDPIDGSEAPGDYPDVDFHLSRLIAQGLIEPVHAPTPRVASRPGRTNFVLTPTYHRLEQLLTAGGLKPETP